MGVCFVQFLRRIVSSLNERIVYTAAMVFILGFTIPIATKLSWLILAMILIPWGITLAYRGFREHASSKKAYFLFAGMGVAIYLCASVLSGESYTDWRDYVYLTAIFVFGLMLVPKKTSVAQMHVQLSWIGAMFVLIYLPFQIAALISQFTGATISVPFVKYLLGLQGKNAFDGRMAVLYNPNVCARYSCCCIIFCLYALFARKNKGLKAFCIFAIGVNTLVIVHTQCRTCYIALGLIAALLCFRAIYLAMASKRILRIGVGLAAAAAAFALMLTMLNGIYVADLKIAYAMTEKTETTQETDEAVTIVPRSEKEGMFDASTSGRTEIWTAALKYMRANPKTLIVGMGSKSPMAKISEYATYPEWYISSNLHLHNSYLSALAHGGVFYLLSILAFLGTLIRPCWNLLIAPSKGENRGLFLLPVAVVMFLAFGMMEEAVFLFGEVTNVFFYVFTGLILHWNELRKVDPKLN